jgi:hypothetical protein
MNAQTRRCEWCCEIVTGQEKCGCEPETEIDRLRGFARDVMSAWPDGGIDGGELQDIAVKHGLLIPETRIEACGENCACVYYGFPTNCHRRVDWILTPNDLA